jgi:superfamily II DNA or RNA helicase
VAAVPESAAPVSLQDLPALRGWQKAAYEEYFSAAKRDFLLVATPGAGKTTYALTVAKELLTRREIQAVTIVTPTEHLKYQWAQAAKRFGIAIDPSYRNAQGRAGADFHGVAVTYAQVAAHPALHRGRTENRRRWSSSTRSTTRATRCPGATPSRRRSTRAKRRLALTGTPFRSDANPIPFVTYVPEADGSKRSASDYVYGYGPGAVRRRGPAGDLPRLLRRDALAHPGRRRDQRDPRHADDQGPDRAGVADRARPGGDWIQRVLEAADKRLTEVRRGMPDAGGLVIAGDHETARAYARCCADQRRAPGRGAVRRPDGEQEDLRLRRLTARWMVAVRMVSEGVDVPRLAVGVYATSVSTPLFFAQAVGRFVRARKRGETASVFVPSVPVLLGFAAELEAERDHVVRHLDRDPGGGARPRPSASARPRRLRTRRPVDRGAEGVRHVRPGAVRRRRVRHRDRGGLRRGGGLPRPARPARTGPGDHAAAQAPGGAAGGAVRLAAARRQAAGERGADGGPCSPVPAPPSSGAEGARRRRR